jgi:hypothetical protein
LSRAAARPSVGWLGAALLFGGCGGLQDAHQLVVEVDVAELGEPPASFERFEVGTTWAGEDRRIPLRDDGKGADARAGDGRFTGSAEGPAVQLLRLRLSVFRKGSSDLVLGDRLIRLPEPKTHLYYSASPSEGRGGIGLERLAGPGGVSGQVRSELLRWAGAVAWIGLCGLWVRLLLRRGLASAPAGPR